MPKRKSPNNKSKCPFRVGDIVRPNSKYPHAPGRSAKGDIAEISKVWLAPPDYIGMVDGFSALPYRVTLTYHRTATPIKNPREGTWVGFLELEPFLSRVRRAIISHESQES